MIVLAESGVSDNTKRTREQQWKRYKIFCDLYDLSASPCSASQASLYVTYLSDKLKPVSIRNYLSAVWYFQKLYGYPDFSGNFLLKQTLTGIDRLCSTEAAEKYPLSPVDLLNMYKLLDMSVNVDKVFWVSLLLAYRCVLRVGHVCKSVHSMKVKHVILTKEYVKIHISSSKTDQFGKNPQDIYLSRLNSPLCPCEILEDLLSAPWATPESNLFRIKGVSSLKTKDYLNFNLKLKGLSIALGLPVDRISTHSIRHGGATMLRNLGLSVDTIKKMGNWRSDAINNYLHQSQSDLLKLDVVPANYLSNLKV